MKLTTVTHHTPATGAPNIYSALDVRHFKMLLALSQAGSVSKAAQVLHITQSAVSHQLRHLEEHYGVALLERRSTPLQFTAAGELLLTLAHDVLARIKQAEQNLLRLKGQEQGTLRIAVECHTCFDWLMPAMDQFRIRWPDIELDIVSGFHADPLGLLLQGKADLAIVSEDTSSDEPLIHFWPLFEFEIIALVHNTHALTEKPYVNAEDFALQPLITYPVPDDMIDVIRCVLKPAGVVPVRRTSELTVAILQLVASGRGIAALPLWAVKSYLDRHYVKHLPIGPQGLQGRLFAASRGIDAGQPYVADFVRIMRDTSQTHLPGVRLM